MGIFANELLAVYGALQEGRSAPELPQLPIQYPDFSVWQLARLNSGELEAQRQHWRQQLTGGPQLLELPMDFARPAQPSGRGKTVSFELPAAVAEGICTLAASCGTTLFATLLSAWQVNIQLPPL